MKYEVGMVIFIIHIVDDAEDYFGRVGTITHIDELFEITITPFPAYKEASVIVQKERQQKELEAQAEEEKKQKEKALKELEELLDD